MFYRPQGLFRYTEITSLRFSNRLREVVDNYGIMKTKFALSKVFGGVKAVSRTLNMR